MTIFPNPTNGIVQFDVFDSNYDNYQVQVFNSLGQQIMQQDLTTSIDLVNQSAGVYFLRFIEKQTLAVGHYKLVLKK